MRGRKIKHYVYISDTKVDMLYSQIPTNLLRAIWEALNFRVKLLGVDLSKSTATAGLISREAKLHTIVAYLEKHQAASIGTVDEPGVYISGTLPMEFTLIRLHFRRGSLASSISAAPLLARF